MMTYKGYSGVAEIDYETASIYGRVVGLRDIITFQGDTVAEAQQAFRDSVDDYLDFCASRGEPPETPFSGRFLLRLAPTLHRALVEAAAARGVSLNALIERSLLAEFAGTEPGTGAHEVEAAPKVKASAKAKMKPDGKGTPRASASLAASARSGRAIELE